MPEAQSLRDLMRIRAHNRTFLDAINGNLGTALGFKKRSNQPLSKEPTILVFVPSKINPKWIPNSQHIPTKLEGPDGLWCALDVVEGGKAQAAEDVSPAVDDLAERLRGWDNQIWAGSQLALWINEARSEYSFGTLGAFVRKRQDGALGLLTNQHVALQPSQKLYHPVPWGTHLATTERVIEYVEDQDWYGPLVDEPNTFVQIDCAFAPLNPNFNQADLNPQMMGVGKLGAVKEISLDDMSIIGQKVLRVGRTTGLRRGVVTAFGYEFVDDKEVTRYTDLLIVGEDGIPFSTYGDSGSLIVTNDQRLNPIGLLWGGWQEKLRTGSAQENWTYGIALSRVLDALNIDLVTSL